MGNECKNCKNYYKHYILINEKGYQEIPGHCISKTKTGRFKKPYLKCEDYSPKTEDFVSMQKRKITKKVVEEMSKQLSNLINFLDDF